LPAGSHAHWNFGFTSNGVYELVFEVHGRRAGVATNDFSRLTPIRFEVQPLPPPEQKPFARWQREQWPGVADETVIGAGADPDRDGVVNAVEYALGLNPHVPDRDRLPQPRLVVTPAGRMLRLVFETPRTATDVVFRAWQSRTLDAGASWQSVPGPRALLGFPESERVALAFEIEAADTLPAGWLRWEAALAP
jgi:hypothetical protein